MTLIRLDRCPGWSESSLGADHFVGFVMRRLMWFCMFCCASAHICTRAQQNQQNGLCIQRWLWSAWACAQSDQSTPGALCVAKDQMFSSCRQQRLWSDLADALWSDLADAQADLSLHWAHRSFCWFCPAAAHLQDLCHVFQCLVPLRWIQSTSWLCRRTISL